MKTVLSKITFLSPTNPEQSLEIIGELDLAQIMSPQNELVAVETRFFSENTLNIRHSILHKADITQIQVFREKKIYTFDKTSLRLTSQVSNFKGLEAERGGM